MIDPKNTVILAIVNIMNFLVPLPLGFVFSLFLLKKLPIRNRWLRFLWVIVMCPIFAVIIFLMVLYIKAMLYFPEKYLPR